MGFDQEKKKKIRESMEYENNGRLTAVANKAASLNAPILIVGLGGTGVDSLIKVKKMIYDRLECEEKAGEIMDKPANIEYLALDTDKANENKSIGGISFRETLDECFIFTSGNIQKKLQGNSLANNIESWIDKNIDISEVINGAGAVRQVGRFMLFDNLKKVEDALESKIRRVTAPFDNTTPLYVFVLAGISGGTGSGTFIDIPYIIKGLAHKIDSNRIVNRIGLLFLPDVNLSQPSLTEVKKENIKKNGFAALKELDYLMNVSNTGDLYEQNYGTFTIGKNADGDIPPYEVCIMISSKDSAGVTVVNPYEYTLNIAAETVVNFIASEPNVAVADFSINSFLSNDKDDSTTFATLLGNDKRPLNYKFAVAGASSAKLPMDDIMSYVTYLAFERLDDIYKRVPKEDEIKDMLDLFGINAKSLEMEICRQLPMMPNLARHTYENIKQAPQMIVGEFDTVFTKRKKHIDARMSEMLTDMKQRVMDKSETNPIVQMFTDIERGPIYTQQMLCTTSDNTCITKELNALSRYFATNGPTVIQLDSLKKIYEAKMNELMISKPLLGGKKNKLRSEMLTACQNYYDAQHKAYYYDVLANLCNQYYHIFMDRNNEVYSCIADLFSTLVDIFEKYGDIKIEPNDASTANEKTMSWSLVNVPDFIRELEQRMNKADDLYVDLHAFVIEFYQYLFQNIDIWTGKEKADVVEKINYFISKEFENILNKSMDYYVEFIGKSYGKTSKEFSSEIYKKLRERSNIMFPLRATYSTTYEQPGYSYVSVPENAKGIQETVVAGVNDKSIVKKSGIRNSIFMMNFKSAMPLAAYADLIECHRAYTNLVGTKAGLHLVEGKESFRTLPSPFPQSEWENGYFVQGEAEMNNKWKAVFDKAVEYGYIKQENKLDGSLCFRCYWGSLVNAESILNKHSIQLDSKQNNVSDVVSCIDEINTAWNNTERLNHKKELYSNRMLRLENGSEVIDVEYAKYIFIKMVTVRKEIEKMVNDHERCQTILGSLSPYIKRKKLYSQYIKLIYTETIRKRRGEYIFTDRADAVQTFCKLDSEQNDYPEYHMFNYYFDKQLEGNKLYTDELKKVCDETYNKKQKSDEEFDAMREKLGEYIEQLKETIDELNLDWREVEDGAAILSTYKDLCKVSESEYKGMQ